MKKIFIILICVMSMSMFTLAAYAENSRQQIKEELFNFIWLDDGLNYREDLKPVNNNPYVAMLYGQIDEFVDQISDEQLNGYGMNYEITEHKIRQLKKDVFDEWCDENYDRWFVEYDDVTDSWYVDTDEYGRLNFESTTEYWRLIDDKNKSVKEFKKPTDLSFISDDDVYTPETQKTADDNITTAPQAETNNNEQNTLSTQQATQNNSLVSSAESQSSKDDNVSKNEREKDDSNNTIIIFAIIVVAGVVVSIIIMNNKNKK